MVDYFFPQFPYQYGCLHIHSYMTRGVSFQDFHQNIKESGTPQFLQNKLQL